MTTTQVVTETEAEDQATGNHQLTLSQCMITWGESVKNHVSTELYQYIQFLNREEDSALKSSFQQAVCLKARVPEKHWAYFWLSRGQKDSETALKRKRQTIGNAMKLKFKELLSRDDVKLPTPAELVGNLLPPPVLVLEQEDGAPSSEEGDVVHSEENEACLRDVKDGPYRLFCSHFIRCVCNAKTFREDSLTRLLSSFVQPTLEAFAVLSYINGYYAWMQMFAPPEDAVSGISSMSGSSNGYRFTGEGRGAKRYQGWSDEGTDLYNVLVDKLEEQRSKRTSGVEFDAELQKVWQSMQGRKRRRGGEDGERKAARHNLDCFLAAL